MTDLIPRYTLVDWDDTSKAICATNCIDKARALAWHIRGAPLDTPGRDRMPENHIAIMRGDELIWSTLEGWTNASWD
jgi:hypothetical protein